MFLPSAQRWVTSWAGIAPASVFVAASLVLDFAPGCTVDQSAVRLGDAQVLYEGQPYGDMVVLASRVRECMHSDKQTLPVVTLVDRIFECYTPFGWRQVFGCTGQDRSYVVERTAVETEGSLWAHELTFFYGATAEGDPCGTLQMPGFSLDRPDAGAAQGRTQ